MGASRPPSRHLTDTSTVRATATAAVTAGRVITPPSQPLTIAQHQVDNSLIEKEGVKKLGALSDDRYACQRLLDGVAHSGEHGHPPVEYFDTLWRWGVGVTVVSG